MSEQTQDDSAAAAAAFESGFGEVHGDAPAPTSTQPAEKAPAPDTKTESTRSDAADSATPDEWEGVAPKVRESIQGIQQQLTTIAGLPERLRKFEGNVGSLNTGMRQIQQQLQSALAKATTTTQTAGSVAPTSAQVQQAQTDPARWKKLREDYPDWSEALEPELADIRAQIAAIPKPQAVDTSALEKKFEERLAQGVAQARKDAISEARGLTRIDLKHDGWEQTVASPEFAAWRAQQPTEVQALGASDQPKDAIRMLDLYTEARKKNAEKAVQAAERKKRLERATAPDGDTVTRTQTTAEEAFESGFKSVLG